MAHIQIKFPCQWPSTEHTLQGQKYMASTDSVPTLETELSPVPVGQRL